MYRQTTKQYEVYINASFTHDTRTRPLASFINIHNNVFVQQHRHSCSSVTTDISHCHIRRLWSANWQNASIKSQKRRR